MAFGQEATCKNNFSVANQLNINETREKETERSFPPTPQKTDRKKKKQEKKK